MNEIYQRAHAVWVRLGPASHDSNLAMDVIDEVLRFPEDMKGEQSRPMKWIRRVLYSSEYAAHRLALYSLFRRPYWKRLWIVQELVLGACTDAPMLCCGNRVSALGLIIKLAKGLHSVLSITQTPSKRKGITAQKLDRAVKVIVDLVNHIEQQSENTGKTGGSHVLSLLKRYTDNKCTDPRDKIYALLGMANLENDSLQVDYSLSLREVFRRTALYVIESSRRLDVLSFCVL